MIKIKIKNRWTGSVLFEYSSNKNTLLKTVLKATGSNADLSDANLSNANLSDANLSNANLRGADLRGANLSDANLSNADLRGADLRGANLSDANLSNANLSNADLRGANLSDANLSNANLSNADLSDADLRWALRGTSIYTVAGIGSAHRTTYFDSKNDMVRCGCFYGTFDEFVKQVENEYEADAEHGITYRAAIEFFKAIKSTQETTTTSTDKTTD